MLRVIPTIISALLLGAHLFRIGDYGLTVTVLAAPFLLLYRRLFILRIVQVLLIIGAVAWIEITFDFLNIQKAIGEPYIRLELILGGVTLFTAISSLLLENKKILNRYLDSAGSNLPSTIVFFLTAITLAIVHLKVDLTMLMLERFLPGWGWFEILGISTYAAFITEKMLDPANSTKWRFRIWTVFSIVFFGQLVIGLLGIEKMLMTGTLHLPVPAMIVAGPLFRGEGFFMPILFLSTIALIGPAWCSHICYIGAWDAALAKRRRTPKKLPWWRKHIRWYILGGIIAVTIILRAFNVDALIATIAGGLFGVIGVIIMVIWSRKSGSMVHCNTYCPIGPLATLLGRVNPFRIRITDSCDDCGKCRLRCRFDALNIEDIEKRKPDPLSCTLCGDCLSSCPHESLEYRFLGMKPENARRLFIILVISIHACTMALARI